MQRTLALLVSGALLFAACSSYNAAPAPMMRPESLLVSKVEGSVFVGVDPYVEKDRQKRVFDADLTDERILPIRVFLQNHGERNLIVRRADIVFELSDGTQFAPAQAIDAAAKLDSIGDVVGWGLGAGIIGYALASSAEEKERSARRADYQSKELRQDITLAKEDSVQGFVYFMPPRGTPPFMAGNLTIRFVDPTDAQVTVVRLPLTRLEFRGWKEQGKK